MEFLMEEEENRTEMDNGDSLSTDKNTNVTERKRYKKGGNKDGGNYYDSCMLNISYGFPIALMNTRCLL